MAQPQSSITSFPSTADEFGCPTTNIGFVTNEAKELWLAILLEIEERSWETVESEGLAEISKMMTTETTCELEQDQPAIDGSVYFWIPHEHWIQIQNMF